VCCETRVINHLRHFGKEARDRERERRRDLERKKMRA